MEAKVYNNLTWIGKYTISFFARPLVMNIKSSVT